MGALTPGPPDQHVTASANLVVIGKYALTSTAISCHTRMI